MPALDQVERLQQEAHTSLSAEWLQAFLEQAERAVPSFSTLPHDQQLATYLANVLVCDFNLSGKGCLPPDIKNWHKQLLEGKYVLQADEVVNVAAPIKQRYEESQQGRCLKLLLTDGKQHVAAFEYRHVPSLKVLLPAGTKVAVENVEVRHGVLLLIPERVVVLGGQVARLEEARQRVLDCWSRPVGTSEGNGPRDLHAVLAAAAWPQDEACQAGQRLQQPPGQPTASSAHALAAAVPPGQRTLQGDGLRGGDQPASAQQPQPAPRLGLHTGAVAPRALLPAAAALQLGRSQGVDAAQQDTRHAAGWPVAPAPWPALRLPAPPADARQRTLDSLPASSVPAQLPLSAVPQRLVSSSWQGSRAGQAQSQPEQSRPCGPVRTPGSAGSGSHAVQPSPHPSGASSGTPDVAGLPGLASSAASQPISRGRLLACARAGGAALQPQADGPEMPSVDNGQSAVAVSIVLGCTTGLQQRRSNALVSGSMQPPPGPATQPARPAAVPVATMASPNDVIVIDPDSPAHSGLADMHDDLGDGPEPHCGSMAERAKRRKVVASSSDDEPEAGPVAPSLGTAASLHGQREVVPATQQAGPPALAGSVAAEPFTYLALVADHVAGALRFPVQARILASINTVKPPMRYLDANGRPAAEFALDVLLEDGTMLTDATLSGALLASLMAPLTPAAMAAAMAEGAAGRSRIQASLTRATGLLSSYTGLTDIRLAGPHAVAEITHLHEAMTAEQAAALAQRAAGCTPCWQPTGS